MKWIKKLFIKLLAQNDAELKVMKYMNSLDKNDSNYYALMAQSYLKLSNGIALRLGRGSAREDEITQRRIWYYEYQYKKYRQLHIEHINQNKDE